MGGMPFGKVAGFAPGKGGIPFGIGFAPAGLVVSCVADVFISCRFPKKDIAISH